MSQKEDSHVTAARATNIAATGIKHVNPAANFAFALAGPVLRIPKRFQLLL